MTEFLRIIPILRIFDVDKTREFYLDYLGFTLEFSHRFQDNSPVFMGVSRGGIMLFLSEHHGDGTPGTRVVIDVDHVDEIARELQAKNYKYMKPAVQEQQWGTRELAVIDPFQNWVVFSQRIR